MFKKLTFLSVIFTITFFSQSIAQNTKNDFEKIIDVTINANTGRIEIDESQVHDLHVFIWGIIKFNIYGFYQNTSANQSITEKKLNLSSTLINTTLAPILIPPARPDPDDRHIDNDTVLLGTLQLDLVRFDVSSGVKNAILSVSEIDNTILDQRNISFTVYDPEQLGDLQITHAETSITTIDRDHHKVRVKAHIRNTGRDDINEKSKVKFYIKIENKIKLIETKYVGPITENNSKSCVIFMDYDTYSKCVGNQLYIIVDEDNNIRERNDFNNYLNYEIPEIHLHPDTIKVFPNPFKDHINFTFFLDQDASPLVTLTLYNLFGINVAAVGFILSPNNTYKTITHVTTNLPPGKYIYTLAVGNLIYQGITVKK